MTYVSMASMNRMFRAIGRRAFRPIRTLRSAKSTAVRSVRLHASADTEISPILQSGVEFVRDGSILIDRRWSHGGVGAQFAEDAATYHQRYFERLAFIPLIERCLDLAAIDRSSVRRVLDIGSGSGASVFALSHLLPQAEIYASDISPELLHLLAKIAESNGHARARVKALCFDLHRPVFRRGTFDLVVGSAILHHLLDPRAALVNVAASLCEGGKIVLVEPLEAGSLVLTALFGTVLTKLLARGEGDGPLARFMRAMRLDIQSRLGVPEQKPWTRGLDDKWVFDRAYLLELGKALGLARVDVHPSEEDLTHVFENTFTSLLSDAGLSSIPIPDDVRECVRAYDTGVDARLKREVCPTGVIVFGR
ncbi:MAG TPA: class I SAM-dependent methyltransferase [Casimicrobiaceae bacterium]|nr:class I SAM-dependent methyltransferase [Casimicrobiaceae bacterium]